MSGTVYLAPPGLGRAKHKTGWTADLAARLALHEAGRGARLSAVAHAAGIGWQLGLSPDHPQPDAPGASMRGAEACSFGDD